MNATQPRPVVLSHYAVTLSLLSQDDLAEVLQWRNLPDIRAQMVNRQPISSQEHIAWFERVNQCPQQLHYVISYKNQKIGVINIRSLDRLPLNQSQNAEVGLFIGEEKYRGNIIAFAPSLVINDFAFNQLNLKLLRSKVRADNQSALKYNQQLGYQLLKGDQDFIPITLIKDDYLSATVKLRDFLQRGR